MTEDNVIEIKKLLFKGIDQHEIARQFNTANSNISMIKKGKAWSHVTINEISNEDLANIKIYVDNRGEKSPKTKLTTEDVIEIKKMMRDGIKMTEISKLYPISPTALSEMKHGRTWKHVQINDIEVQVI